MPVSGDELAAAISALALNVITGTVANYSALPAPNTVSGKFYWVSNTQGSSFWPGTLGGTFYNIGVYHSNGTTWEYISTPYQALQAAVDAGLITDQFVTPNTLANSIWAFTVAKVLGTLLAGLNTALTGTITSSDSILSAFGRLQNSISTEITNRINADAALQSQINALIIDSIADGDTTHAPSRNAVYDALQGISSSYIAADTVVLNSAKSYADSLVVGLLDDRGNHNASSNLYPSSGGSGTAGAILKGDLWTISTGGNLGGVSVTTGDVVRALTDAPGQTSTNWTITENNIGYVPENSTNKGTTMTGNTSSNIIYLTAKAIFDWATGLFTQRVISTTDNAIVRFDGTTGQQQNSNVIIGDDGSIIFPSVSLPIYGDGKLVYDQENRCLTFFNASTGVAMQIGREGWIRFYNNSGATIANGKPVYVSGFDLTSGYLTIGLADASDATKTLPLGLTTESILNSSAGEICYWGDVHNIDTSAFTAGVTVYLGTTPGGLTTTAPLAPNYQYRIGKVGKSDATTGWIQVTPSTARLGNGTANQILGMNNAGTAQEVKSIAMGSRTAFSFAHTPNNITINQNQWVDYSAISTVTGWTAPSIAIMYIDMGAYFIYKYFISGASLSGTASMTLHVIDTSIVTVNEVIIRIASNGVNSAGLSRNTTSSNVVNFFATPVGGSFSVTGVKAVGGIIIVNKP